MLYLTVSDNCKVAEIPEELLEVFPEEGHPGTKRSKFFTRKDEVLCIQHRLNFKFLRLHVISAVRRLFSCQLFHNVTSFC